MSRTIIMWADAFSEATHPRGPEKVLGEPDGDSYMISRGGTVTLSDFRGRAYRDLAALLPAVAPADLAGAHVLAFELNGGHPAPSGGWESCFWHFTDGTNTHEVDWDERMGIAPDPSVVANGSIRGREYSSYFGFSPSIFGPHDPNHIVISYLLFKLPKPIDPTSRSFRIRISGVESIPNKKEATPDVDAVGVLGCHTVAA